MVAGTRSADKENKKCFLYAACPAAIANAPGDQTSLLMKWYYFFLTLLLSGCGNNFPGTFPGVVTPIALDNRNIASEAILDELVQDIEWTPLETSRAAIVGNAPYQIAAYGDRLFLLYTGINSTLAIFDRYTGKFIKKLSAQGNGPGEFSKITNFSVRPERKIIEITAGFERKVLGFDFDGNVRSEVFCEIPFTNKAFLPDGGKVVYTQSGNGMFTGGTGDFELLALDESNALHTGIKPLDVRHPTSLISAYLFFPYRDSLRFIKPFCDTIFQVGFRSVAPRYVVYFKKGSVGRKFWENPNLQGTRDEIHQLHHIPSLQPIYFENDRIVFGVYQSDDGLSHHFVYEKASKTVRYNFNRLWYKKWDIPLPPPLHVSTEGLLFLLAPDELKTLVQEHPAPSLLPADFRQAIQTAQAGDNPFLVHLRFKH